MWPFIFIMAMVPLIYYWSDSVAEVFPVLAQYLPAKHAQEKIVEAGTTDPTKLAQVASTPGRWTQALDTKGFVTWVLSTDGQYRIVVGCRAQDMATLRVTHISGKDVPAELTLDYGTGTLPVTRSIYQGTDILNAMSQFGAVTASQKVEKSHVPIAVFQINKYDSGVAARGVQQHCVIPMN